MGKDGFGQGEVAEFGRLFRRFLDEIVHREMEPTGRPSLVARLREHLGQDPLETPVVTATYPAYDHANVHVGLEAWFATGGRSRELVGVSGGHRSSNTLSELLEMAERHGAYGVGPVDYVHLPVSVDEELACVGFGFFLGVDGDERTAVLLRSPELHGPPEVRLEVMAPSRDSAKRLLAGAEELMRERNVFRGKVVSISPNRAFEEGAGPISFHRRPSMDRDAIVLPAGLLERVERQVLGVARHGDRLRAAGQQLRRGVLLYGPPGTGKTHTLRYLLSRLPDFTVVLLTGTSLGFIGPACALARMLQPALVVLEDCDLVAEARDFGPGMENPLLFEMLNEMDGLEDEVDVAFLLTTNRADLLEPALAQRPGRVDLAVEIPLPDAAGRARLLQLYGPDLKLPPEILAELVVRTDGTTASFAKELVRRAILLAAERGADETAPQDLRNAADELLSDRDALTRRLLGAADAPDPEPTY
ncbi:AAA family ATPase [Actinopolymorpha singaporensis]